MYLFLAFAIQIVQLNRILQVVSALAPYKNKRIRKWFKRGL